MAPNHNNHHQIRALEQSLSARFGWQTNAHWRDGLLEAVKKKSEKLRFDEDAYCRMAIGSTGELEALAEMVANGETRFFREPEQFEALRESVIPELMSLRAREKKLDLWSAACSTGEEAYSLAILLSEAAPESEHWKMKLLATDLRASAIVRASRGSFPASSVKAVSRSLRNRHFIKSDGNGSYDVTADLKKMISFRRANLYDPKFWDSSRHQFDLILCNNLLVYFHALAVKQTVDRLADSLRTGGLLMVMSSEASYVHHQQMKLDRSLAGSFFRKI
ncbi:MAG TPA: protein-glutamate O-methyltransferase CheR [Blastocatellia bacterium]|jgi:chemotaxis protein methyltransferase CheR